jgi:rhodanese-related sulfurtransferase
VHLPDTGRDAKAEYLQEHIPGAGFFDLSVIANPNNPLPRKFPPKDIFIREVSKLGIDNQTHVIAYDTPGLYSAARVWWLFRQYGYDHVSILDGGLKSWKAHGLAVEAGAVEFTSSQVHVDHDLLASARALLGNESGIACILGTGSNSCLFLNGKIIENIPSWGYMFGDFGSGAHIGKEFIQAYANNQFSSSLKKELEAAGIDRETITRTRKREWSGHRQPRLCVQHARRPKSTLVNIPRERLHAFKPQFPSNQLGQ